MSNVLSDEKREQVLALGRLGWSLRRIEEATGVRRETASQYLRSAGVVVRRPGADWGSGHQNRPPRQGCPPTLGRQILPPGRRRCRPPRQNRPPRQGCPPTLGRQNRPPRRRCPPSLSGGALQQRATALA